MKNLFKLASVGINAYVQARVAAAEVLNSVEMQEALAGTVRDVLTAYKESGLKASVDNFRATEEAMLLNAQVIGDHIKANIEEIIEEFQNEEEKKNENAA